MSARVATLLALPALFAAGALVGYLGRGGVTPAPAGDADRARALEDERDALARELALARLEIADLRSRPAERREVAEEPEADAPAPDTPEAAESEEDRERAKEQLDGLEYHLSADPTDASLLARYVTTAARAGEFDRAIALLEKLAKEHPENPDVQTQLGRAYLTKTRTLSDMMEQGRLAFTAVGRFDAALKSAPDHFDSRYLRGITNFHMPAFLGRMDQSISDFERLVGQNAGRSDDDRFARAYAWLSRAYRKAGREEDARKAVEEGLRLFPADPNLLRVTER